MKRIILILFNAVAFVFFIVGVCFCQVSVAQSFKIGKNLTHIKSGVILDLEDATQALLLTRVFNPSAVIAGNAYRGMIVFDSSVNKLAYYDGTAWVYPISNIALDTSIYSQNGTLQSNRIVTMNAYHLTLNSTNGNFIFNPTGTGKLGIGQANPMSKFHVMGAMRADSLVLTNLALDNGNSNQSLTIDANGIVKIKNSENNILQGVKSSGGNGFGDTIRVGSYDAHPLRLYAGNTAGLTIKPTGNPNYIPLDSTKIYLRGIAYDANSQVSIFSFNANGPFVSSGSLSAVVDGDINTSVNIATRNGWVLGGAQILGFKVALNGYYYIDSVVIAWNGNPNSVAGRYIYVLRDGARQIAGLIGNENGIYRTATNGQLGNEVGFAYTPTSNNNGNSNLSGSEIYIYGRRSKAIYPGLSETRINGILAMDNIVSGKNTDSILTINTNTGEIRGIDIGSIASVNNIYTSNGSLQGDRMINMASNNLTFTGSNHMALNSSETNMAMGIRFNENGVQKWHIEKTNDNDFTMVESGVLERIRIKAATGNVGIGTANPTQKLDVNGSGIFRNILQANTIFMNATGSEGSIFNINQLNGFNDLFFSGNNGTNVHMYIANGGNVGIGNTSPAHKLDVGGDIRVGGTIFGTRVQGVSDARLKQNVVSIQGALQKILQLKGVIYTWRKDMEKQTGYTFKVGKDYGVIAQEIKKILPELVQEDGKGFLTVDYAHITPVLIEAIKEQHHEMENLKNKVQQIEMLRTKAQEVDRLKTEMNELKNMVQEMKKSIKP